MKRLIGSVLQAVGILIAGASGLCSAGYLFTMGGSDAILIPFVLIFGSIPFAFGLVLYRGGRLLIRDADVEDKTGPNGP